MKLMFWCAEDFDWIQIVKWFSQFSLQKDLTQGTTDTEPWRRGVSVSMQRIKGIWGARCISQGHFTVIWTCPCNLDLMWNLSSCRYPKTNQAEVFLSLCRYFGLPDFWFFTVQLNSLQDIPGPATASIKMRSFWTCRMSMFFIWNIKNCFRISSAQIHFL